MVLKFIFFALLGYIVLNVLTLIGAFKKATSCSILIFFQGQNCISFTNTHLLGRYLCHWLDHINFWGVYMDLFWDFAILSQSFSIVSLCWWVYGDWAGVNRLEYVLLLDYGSTQEGYYAHQSYRVLDEDG